MDLSSYLELRQVQFKFGKLHASYLKSNCVYVMDCLTDVFIWYVVYDDDDDDDVVVVDEYFLTDIRQPEVLMTNISSYSGLDVRVRR